MKFAYFLAIAVGAQDGGDGGTPQWIIVNDPHDPEARLFVKVSSRGPFKGI